PLSRSVGSLLQDRQGTIWAGTDGGLYRVDGGRSPVMTKVALGGSEIPRYVDVHALMEDRRGNLWIGAGIGLFRRSPEGRVDWFGAAEGLPQILVEALLEDSAGRVWAATRAGLCLLVADAEPRHRVVSRVFTAADGLADSDVKALALTEDGGIWAGCLVRGLSEVHLLDGNRVTVRNYSIEQGLSDETIIALASDKEGNLWLGSSNGGA